MSARYPTLYLAVVLLLACGGASDSEPKLVDAGETSNDGDAGESSNDGGVSDAGDMGPDAAVVPIAPSPDCITPCLWDLLMTCRPVLDETCTSSTVDAIENRCYSGGIKIRVDSSDEDFFPDAIYYWPDGSVCFTSTYENSITTYLDGSGALLITRYHAGATQTVNCNGQDYSMQPSSECIGTSLDLPECIAGMCEVE